MPTSRTHQCRTILLLLSSLLVLRVVVTVVLLWPRYLPPDFTTDFLRGRESTFFGPYQWSFNVHIVSGPWSLAVGLLLLSDRFRRHWPGWHRVLGRTQVVVVLAFVAPSGFWMAGSTQEDRTAGAGFAALAMATAVSAAAGWRTALQRRFAAHRRWMWRCYVLLCSAVVLRAIGGGVTVAGVTWAWSYAVAAWVSWLGPLAVCEFLWWVNSDSRQVDVSHKHTGVSAGQYTVVRNTFECTDVSRAEAPVRRDTDSLGTR